MRRELVVLGLAIFLLIAGSTGPATAQPQYFNYNTAGDPNAAPFNQPEGKRVQLLFLPGDFNQPTAAPPGNIATISFKVHPDYPLGPWNYFDLSIKMGQSSITSFTAGGFYGGTLTTVYYRQPGALTGTAGGWLDIALDTPFAYDPTLSLIVDIGQCSASGATGFSSCMTGLTGNRRTWSVGGCPFAYDSADSYIAHVGITLGAAIPAPTVDTTAATSVTTTGATLNGTVNANGASTTVTFQYGPSDLYGYSAVATPSPVTGTTDTLVSANVTGLDSNTLYHCRVVGASSGGTSNGDDMTFRTAAPPVPTVTEWGLMLLALLIGIASVHYLRRRRPTAQETGS